MTDLIYIIFILVLTGAVYYLFQQNQKNVKLVNDERGRTDTKIQTLHQEQDDRVHEITDLKEKELSLAEENEKLKKKLNYIENTNKNKGELMAARQLDDILREFKREGLISRYDIFNNVLLYDSKNPRQIDHLAVCDKGIYIIETKCWEGDIYYNVSKDTLKSKNMQILNRYVFHDDVKKDYKTFVLKTNEKGLISYKDYGHPFEQVLDTIKILRKELEEAQGLNAFINGIVYFNYESGGKYTFIDGTAESTKIRVANQKENLRKQFEEDFTRVRYSPINQEKYGRYIEALKRYVFNQ